MNAMLTKYLKDFSAPQPVGPVGNDILDSLPGASFPEMDFVPEPEPQIDIEAERQEAHAQGYYEAAQYFQEKHAAEIETLHEAYAGELRSMTEAHENEVIGVIHARFHEMTQVISQQIAEQTLQALLPVFSEEICRRALTQLADMVQESLVESGVSTVVVRGPARLYDRLKLLLDTHGIESRFIESAATDISVEIDDTVLVTRLASWAQALSEVIG
jgi:hypothetical protein